MIFQTFDDKKECKALYTNNKLFFKKFPKNLTKTWSYSEFLKNKNEIEYAQLYCNGKSLDEICPPYLKEDWDGVNGRLKAYCRAIKEVKLNIHEHCFFEMVPRFFLLEYAKIKNRMCAHVFENYEKPENYDFLFSLTKLLTEIRNEKLDVDYSQLNNRMHEFKVRQFVQKNKNVSPYIEYNIYGTKTGRLSTAPASFPILTMDKTYRKILKPKNGWFIEFDFNAAELRTMLGLLNVEQPQEDLHEWNLKNVYRDIGTRDKAKKRIFAWLYNPESKDYLSSQIYNRDLLLKKHWNGSQIQTIYNRKIEADKHHALNYIIQSTASDLFLRQMIKVQNLLEDRDSRVAFCLHDSLVLDYSEKDNDILIKLKKTFAETDLGNYLVNVSVGENFGEMKKLNL